MAITAAMVKELRDKTARGMMDAKKALTESDGDMKRHRRAARQGTGKGGQEVGPNRSGRPCGRRGRWRNRRRVEVNSETDFVARNAEFQEMVAGIASAALTVADVDALKAASMNGKTVAEVITDKVATSVRTCRCAGAPSSR